MIETVFSVELPVREHLRVQKNRIIGKDLAEAAQSDPSILDKAPRLAVVTGIHGDELEGQCIVYELAKTLEPHLDHLHGIIDIYPAVNPLGINAIQRGVPGYDLDLNRIFPGDAEGPLADTLAAAVVDDITGAVACVDIHASNIFLREMPQVRINVDSADMLLPLAPLLNVDFIWVHASATVLQSTLAYSLNARNTPTFVVETGVGMRITPDEDIKLAQGLLRLAAHFGIWSGSFEEAPAPAISEDTAVSFLNAEAAGIFLAQAQHGTRIRKGDIVGQIVNPLEGKVMQEIISPEDGLLFTLREYPVVYPGSLLARILVQ